MNKILQTWVLNKSFIESNRPGYFKYSFEKEELLNMKENDTLGKGVS
jgi:hypothetical protein